MNTLFCKTAKILKSKGIVIDAKDVKEFCDGKTDTTPEELAEELLYKIIEESR